MDYQSQYLKNYGGGSAWDAINGQLPGSMYYDATGQPHQKSGWERAYEWTFSPQGFGTMIGGLAAYPAVAGAFGGAGSAASGAAGAAAAGGHGLQTALTLGSLASQAGSFLGGRGGGGGSMAGYNYNPYQTTPSYGASYQPSGGSYGYGGDSSQLFSDPTTQPLMSQWAKRMAQLNAPTPHYGDLEGMARGSLQMDPRLNSIVNALKGMMGGSMPANPYSGQYATETKNRIAQLHQNPFSSGDEANIKARFYDNLERSRSQSRQQVLEQMGQLGHSPTDGAIIAALQGVDQNYDQQRADATQKLLEYTYGEQQNRLNEALAASQGLASFGQQEQGLANQFRGSQISAGNAAAGILSDQQNRAAQVAQLLAGLRQQGFENEMTQGNQALQTSALPSELAQQRLATVYSMLSGMAPSPNSIMAGLGQIGQQTGGMLGNAQAGNAALLQMLGALAQMQSSQPQTKRG